MFVGALGERGGFGGVLRHGLGSGTHLSDGRDGLIGFRGMAHQDLVGLCRSLLQSLKPCGHGCGGLGHFADHVLQVDDKAVYGMADGAQFVFGADGDAPRQVGIAGGQCVDIGFQRLHALHQFADRIRGQQHQQQYHGDLQQGQSAEYVIALRGDQRGGQGGGEEPRRTLDWAHIEGAGHAAVIELAALQALVAMGQGFADLGGEG